MNPLEKIETDKLNKSQEITKKYYDLSNNVKVSNVNKLLKFADLELETLIEENKSDDIDLSELLELDINQNFNSSINETTNELKNNKNSNMTKNSEKNVRKEIIEEEIVSNSNNENKSTNKINSLDIVEDDEN